MFVLVAKNSNRPTSSGNDSNIFLDRWSKEASGYIDTKLEIYARLHGKKYINRKTVSKKTVVWVE